MRYLIKSLEQPPLMFSHPHANCFHRRVEIDPSLSTSAASSADRASIESTGSKISNITKSSGTDVRAAVSIASECVTPAAAASSYSSSVAIDREKDGAKIVDASKFSYVSSFFIGLSFKNHASEADLRLIIQVH